VSVYANGSYLTASNVVGKGGGMSGTVTRLEPAQGATLGAQLAAGREQFFVGRQAELEQFVSFADAQSPVALWFIHGAGGMGKSTLLQRLHDSALQQRVACVYLDARRVAPNPPAVESALARAAGARSLESFCAAHTRPVLFVDSFEYWQVLDEWLRRDLLPVLPRNLALIVAGRAAPGPAWLDDARWGQRMQVTNLGALAQADCEQYLQRRDIVATNAECLIAFSRGNALALAMAADAHDDGSQPELSPKADGSVYETLLRNFTREVRDPAEHFALDACAVAYQLDEQLLTQLLARDDAGDSHRWLAGLSFIDQGPEGLYPHDVVREALLHTMPRRAPGRYEAIARATVNGIVDRMERQRGLTPAAAAHLGAQGLYALRQIPVVQHYLHGEGSASLYVDRVRSEEDWRTLAAMTRRHEGDESCAWFEFWRVRFPENVTVIRGIRGDARAYVLRLDMEQLDAADRAADPLTRRLWQFVTADIQKAARETVVFNRFWINYDYAEHDSPEKAQMLTHMTHHNMSTPGLRLTAQVFDTRAPTWPQQARAIGLYLVDEHPIIIGEHGYHIFYNDWLREPPMRYYRLFADRCIAFEQAMSGMAQAEPAPVLLEYEAFQRAVLDALRQLKWPAALAGNPLLASAAVLASADRAGDGSDRVQILCDWLQTAIDALEQTHSTGPVLRSAYLEHGRNQKAAADALSMTWSSYRRNLAAAREALATELWRRELACRRN
jgi:hypothetical protein